MTDIEKKREEIWEGLQQIGRNWFCSGGLSQQTMPNERSFEGDILKCLHSQGVVILAPDVPIERCSFVESLVGEE